MRAYAKSLRNGAVLRVASDRGEPRELRGDGPCAARDVEQADLGDRADRMHERGLPIELIAAAVPAEAARREPLRAQQLELRDERAKPGDLLLDGQREVRRLGHPERHRIALVPAARLVRVARDALLDGPCRRRAADRRRRDGIEVVARDHVLAARERGDAGALRIGQRRERLLARGLRLDAELQIPDQPAERALGWLVWD